MNGTYGEEPKVICYEDLSDQWQEFMTYLYLPVMMPNSGFRFALPDRLEFARHLLVRAVSDLMDNDYLDQDNLGFPYVYLTAKRGWVTPGSMLNRPGWHCDGFGTDDINYVWCDGVGMTEFAEHEFVNIDTARDAQSMIEFDDQAKVTSLAKPQALTRLTPFVVHRPPTLQTDSGMRSFLKISCSRERYNLVGNSHNYLLDYDWDMQGRERGRNDPAGGKDFVK